MTKPPRFDLPDLRLFVAVADAGSLSRGAASLPLALSAASARLRALEDRLGLALFERHPSGVCPTEAGLVLLDHARRVCRAADEAQSAMDRLVASQRETLTLYTNTTGNSTFLPPAIGQFLARYPMVDVRLEECASRDVIRAVTEGRADLGVIDDDYRPEALLTYPFRRDRLVVIAPRDHPLAERQAVSLAEVAAEPLVGLPQRSGMQLFLDKMATLAGLTLRPRAQATSFSAVAQLVEQGAGLGILPEVAARQYQAAMALAVLPLDERWAVRELQVCVRRENLPFHVDQLVRHLAGIGR
ncbi:LysR family transcriptional regulator [Chitinimonas lacunae]|uniref:LysR family transcriptional regulator n=1 Tax=Chitinimonas lacunae TaxID=1963018 RepID=A0ABV8MX89_9NEIS